MSTQTAVTTQKPEAPSIIQDMATRFGMDKRAFELTLKATVVPATVSNEQFVAFLLVAKQYNLNPITKEIYAFPAKGGGIQPIVGIDGWCNLINSKKELDGIEFHDVLTDGKITAITCKIFRKDRTHPTECTEYLSECKRDTQPWNQWPIRMLRHKALIQCARYAFSLSGIVDPDEAERMIDVTPAVAQVDTKIRPYDVDKSKPKSPFKNNSLRSHFVDLVEKEFKECTNLQDLNLVMETREAVLSAMGASGDERDTMCHEDLELKRKQTENRLAISTRETPDEDTDTFDEDESDAPSYLKTQMEEERERLESLSR